MVTDLHDGGPDEHLDLVTVASGEAAIIAVAKSVLQAAGIDFVAKNEDVQDLFGWGRFPRGRNLLMGPIQLQVRAADAPYALEVLKGVPEAGTPTEGE